MGKLTDEQKIEAARLYETGKYSGEALGRMFGLKGGSVLALLRRRGIKIKDQSQINRKYALNESFFDQIDTEEKAYFLGLLYADGCNNEKTRTVAINLNEDDKDILDKFKDAIKSERPIKYIVVKGTNLKKKDGSACSFKNLWSLYFCSKKLSNSLAKQGCVAAKSLILDFPDESVVPNDLKRHFIRGYFDGDGCISLENGKNIGLKMSFMSTDKFCLKAKGFIEKELGIYCEIQEPPQSKNGSPSRVFRVSGSQKAQRVMEWLYKDSTVFLARKRTLFERYSKIINERSTMLFIEAFGEKKHLNNWAKDPRCVVSRSTIQYRLKNGWTPEDAMTKKRRSKND